ncbi:hypothetical protein Hanom_Chr13g01210621 [Helianthus anomalus]
MQTPGVSSGRLSVGMTPKTLQLPKQGEMLLSVHGSPQHGCNTRDREGMSCWLQGISFKASKGLFRVASKDTATIIFIVLKMYVACCFVMLELFASIYHAICLLFITPGKRVGSWVKTGSGQNVSIKKGVVLVRVKTGSGRNGFGSKRVRVETVRVRTSFGSERVLGRVGYKCFFKEIVHQGAILIGFGN